MPKKTVVTKQEFEENEIDNSKPAADDEADTLDAFFKALPGGSTVKIHRYNRMGNLEFVGSTPVENISEEWIQMTFGGGKYVLRLTDSQGKYRGTRTIYLAAPIDGPPAAMPAAMPAAQVEYEGFNEAPATPAFSGMDPMITLQIETMREEARTNRELMAHLIEKIGNGNAPAGPTMPEMMAMIASMRTVFQPAEPAEKLTGMMELLKTGIEIGQTGSVDGKKEGIMGIVKDIAAALPGAIQGIAALRSQAAPAQAGPSQAPPAGELPAGDGMQMLVMGIKYLKQKALLGKQPEFYAEFILNSLEDPQWQPFLRYLETPYEDFAKIDPDLLRPEYRPWFERMLNEVKAGVAEMNAPAESGDIDANPA